MSTPFFGNIVTRSAILLGWFSMPNAGDILRMRVAALLAANDRTQKELAAYLGHTPAWATDFLRGRQNVLLRDLDKIARFFGLSVPQLFEIDGVRFRERRGGERRTGERRSGLDRRVSAPQKPTIE